MLLLGYVTQFEKTSIHDQQNLLETILTAHPYFWYDRVSRAARV